MKAFFYILLIVSSFFMIIGCGPDTASTDTEETPSLIDPKSVNSKLSPEYRNLMAELKANPNDHNRNGSYVNRIAKEYIKTQNPKKALDILKTGIIFHSESKSHPENVGLFLETLAGLEDKKVDYINYVQSMQIGSGSFPGLAEHIKNIPAGEKPVRDKIVDIRSNLTDTSTGRLDLVKVNEFVNIIELFVMANPTNDQSPSYLKLAAEVVNSVKVFPRAIQFYDWILTKFPNSKEAPQALFMKGFTLDDGMRNKAAAKPVYEEFLKKYPDNDFADDTEFLLSNINKSDEEIIKQFEDKKK
jgi:tetratricopeptide (TPR) repeat protein